MCNVSKFQARLPRFDVAFEAQVQQANTEAFLQINQELRQEVRAGRYLCLCVCALLVLELGIVAGTTAAVFLRHDPRLDVDASGRLELPETLLALGQCAVRSALDGCSDAGAGCEPCGVLLPLRGVVQALQENGLQQDFFLQGFLASVGAALAVLGFVAMAFGATPHTLFVRIWHAVRHLPSKSMAMVRLALEFD